jgi:hypothetical protein
VDQPRATPFINVLAWVFILLAAGGVIMGLIQNLVVHFWPPLADLVRQHQTAPTGAGLFSIQRLIVGNLPAIMLANLLLSALVLLAAIGLLRRRNWARLLFIALMLLGIVWAAASFIMVLQADPLAAALPEVPPEYQPVMAGARTPSLLAGGIFTVLFCALLGWIAWRLSAADVARQFRPQRRE